VIAEGSSAEKLRADAGGRRASSRARSTRKDHVVEHTEHDLIAIASEPRPEGDPLVVEDPA
jgi:hypothetical protein